MSEEIELQEVDNFPEEYFPSNYEQQNKERCENLNRYWWLFRYYIRKYLVGSSVFENIIMLAILSNCVLLALDTPNLEEENPSLRQFLDTAEFFYFFIFAFEMVLKMIAFGLHRPSDVINDPRYINDPEDQYVGYFNDGWSLIDFVIVCTSVTIFFSSANVSSIRVLRVLKPLRTISRVKGLKVMVETLLKAFPELVDVCILIMFLFLVFGIIAVQTFQGALHRRCIADEYWNQRYANFSWAEYTVNVTNYGSDASLETFCPKDGAKGSCGDLDFFDEDLNQPFTYVCREEADGPYAGMMGFDNILYAFFTQFVLVTLEGWADVMYIYSDAMASWTKIYFIIVTFVCAFFALNLTLAVIVNIFSNVNEEVREGGDDEVNDEVSLPPDPTDITSSDQELSESIEFKGFSLDDKKKGGNRKGPEKIDAGNAGTFIVAADASATKSPQSQEEWDVRVYDVLSTEAIRVVMGEKSMKRLGGQSNPFITFCNKVALSDRFSNFVLIVILANTVVLAMQWPGMSESLIASLETINLGFTIFFMVEMVLKLIGLGICTYLKDTWNVFDGAIVMISCLELGLSESGGLSSLRALRMFRVLRVLRVLGKIEGLRVLLGALSNAAGDVMYLLIIPFIFIFMFGTLGISVFASTWDGADEGDIPREQFDSIGKAMLTVFRVITGDNWNEVMFTYMEPYESTTQKWIIGFYFIAIIIFGNFILLNLFIAVLLSRMASERQGDIGTMDEETFKDPEAVCDYNKWLYEDLVGYTFENQDEVNSKDESKNEKLRQRLIQYCVYQSKWMKRQKKMVIWAGNRDLERMAGWSLGCMNIDNDFRLFVWSVVHNRIYSGLIDLMIVINCILLMLEAPPTPNVPQPEVDTFFLVSDYFFTIIFVLEMVLKIIADGCFAAPIFAIRTWNFNHSFDDGFDTSGGGDYVFRWKQRCLRMLMELQSYDERIQVGDARDGEVLNILESSDGWIIVNYDADTYQQEFRLLFKSNSDAWLDPETIYTLEDTSEPSMQGKWTPVTGRANLEDVDPSLVNIMCSPDLTNARLNAYFADGWNQLDGFVVFISIISIMFPQYAGLRALRAVRPLRLAIRFDGVRVVLEALIGAIPGVMYTMMFCLLFWMVLAILGTSLFSETFGSCTWEAAVSREQCVQHEAFLAYFGDPPDEQVICRCEDTAICGATWQGDYSCRAIDPESGNLQVIEWTKPDFNFDTVIASIQSIYVISTMDEWAEIMYNGMDIVGKDMAFRENASWWYSIYFLIVVLVGGFLSFNLIVSVVVDNFDRIKEQKSGSIFMTESQAQWQQNQKLLARVNLEKRYPQPRNKWRKYCFLVTMNPYFDPMIMLCIILNALTMSMNHYKMSDNLLSLLETFDLGFIVIFSLEAILKITALGWSAYTSENWNKFDFAIVLASVAGIFLNGGAGVSVARVFRIGRILRLINKAETLKTLFETLVLAIPSLWNIGLLLFVIFFIYAVIGMNIFGAIEPNAQGPNGISDKANFQSWMNSMELLYRIGTSDAWGPIFLSCAGKDPYCHGPTCGSALASSIFFMSFGVIGTLVMINLFVAVILETFEDSLESRKQEKLLQSVFIWSEIWSQVDTNCDEKLEVTEFLRTVLRAPKPAGLSTFEDAIRVLESTQKNSPRVMSFKAQKEELMKTLSEEEIRQQDYPQYPSQQMILDYLRNLNLLVTFEVVDGERKWICNYRDAVFAIGTRVVGLKLAINAEEIDEDRIPVYDWYTQVFARDDRDDTKKEESRI